MILNGTFVRAATGWLNTIRITVADIVPFAVGVQRI